MGNTYQQPPQPVPIKPGDPKKNALAITGFVLSLIGLLLSAGKFPIILAIAGLVLSILGSKSQKKGLSTAGIVLGAIGIVMGFVFIVGGDSTTEKSSAPVSSSIQQNTQEQSKAQDPVSSDEGQVTKIGSRKNPAKIGDTVTFEMDSIMYGKGILEITLTDLMRGSEAATYVAEANMFNDEAEPGKEYILATFAIKNIKDKSMDDSPITVNGAQFSFADGTYAKEKQLNMVSLDNNISSELYEGSEITGMVCFVATADDACYAIYQDKLWFSLS